MRTRCQTAIGLLAAAVLLTPWLPAAAQENPVSLDPQKGTLGGSPVDHLPPHIRLLDIQLPDGGTPMRPDWSPDGQRLVFLDAPLGDVWEHDLAAGTNRNLTEAFLPAGVLRAHHLSNGDLVLCAPAQPDPADPEGDRFRGELWVLSQPLGTRAPVALGERCWEGIAVSKHAGSTRIAWNQSSIDFTDFPNVFLEALVGTSVVLTGRIVYDDTGRPSIAERTLVLDKHDVSLDTPAVEAQDFRSLDDGDDDPDDELIFSAYFHNGGQAMGVDLDSGAITDYAPLSPFYEEAEGADPAGRYVLVERDLTVTLFPGMLDIWRLALDGSGTFERLTTFDHHRGYGANNPVVSPAGDLVAFSLKVEGEEGEGDGILLFDLTAPTASGSSGPFAPTEPPTTPTTSSPSAAPTPSPAVAVEDMTAGESLARTGAPTATPTAASLLALALLAARLASTTGRRTS